MTIREFANFYGDPSRKESDMVQTYKMLIYWDSCGYQDMNKVINDLEKEERKKILLFMINNDYCAGNSMVSRSGTRVAARLIESL